MMCAYVCERGTVEVDSWAVQSLNYQRQLQRTDDFIFYEMPSTHNSAISEADGYGIEKYFISALGGGMDLDEGDDVGEGVCQYLSLTDQMRMGVRHLEIDLWWDRLVDDLVVCHSPVPLYPVGKINRQAEAAGLDLEWDPKNMSCLGTKRGFTDVLTEVRDWMTKEENLEEIVVLYFDTKFFISPPNVAKANAEILNVFGKMLWGYTEGNPLEQSVSGLISANKRIMIEANREEWLHTTDQTPLVFYPTLWTHQFGASSLEEFPNCTISGDASWYGTQWVRALDGSFIEAATRCGVQVVSGDYMNPDDMKLFVWSWDQQEPSVSAADSGCVAMLPSGRWATLDCNTELPYACLADNSNSSGGSGSGGNATKVAATPAGYALDWTVDLTTVGAFSAAACPKDTSFAAPHNGYANNVLLNSAFGQTIWLNAPNPLI